MSGTEHAARRFADLELWDTGDAVETILEAQMAAVAAAHAARGPLSMAVEAAAERLRRGGRLIWLGAGTSGRLAMLDAAELQPTFGWPRERALALLAGGDGAFVHAAEGAEDDTGAARRMLDSADVAGTDVVIGVAASGRTPFVLAGIAHARARGALTIGILNNPQGALSDACEIAVLADTGAEVIAGSTRMKAGTAQKVLLNTFSTAVMLRLGYVFRGRMIEMRPTNAKLRQRAVEMVAELAEASPAAAEAALTGAEGSIKVAVVMLRLELDHRAAAALIVARGGTLRAALGE